MTTYDGVATSVVKLFNDNNNGHGFDHIERVLNLALKFAEREGADRDIITMASLLHEVDDYKIFGEYNAKNLLNANKILDEHRIINVTKDKVLGIISTMGYNKYLEGVRPTTLEGMIVSDADMCDSIGAEGILRTYAYNTSKGNLFFDRSLSPRSDEISASEYRSSDRNHSVQHFFDKLLKISPILMTRSGKEEGERRQKIMIDFLFELFREEGAEDWRQFLKSSMHSKS